MKQRKNVSRFIDNCKLIVNIMLYDMNLKDILISPFKTWGSTTSEKKREKDVLKVAVLIYQLSTSEECHIGVR